MLRVDFAETVTEWSLNHGAVTRKCVVAIGSPHSKCSSPQLLHRILGHPLSCALTFRRHCPGQPLEQPLERAPAATELRSGLRERPSSMASTCARNSILRVPTPGLLRPLIKRPDCSGLRSWLRTRLCGVGPELVRVSCMTAGTSFVSKTSF